MFIFDLDTSEWRQCPFAPMLRVPGLAQLLQNPTVRTTVGRRVPASPCQLTNLGAGLFGDATPR